ncbi:choline dehydrogenase [Paucimonas lemoignei]|uniref:Choline dehydrogenase n=1 Tax=Paucimonas lemoignei TaxID=29443 RepID=A0A4R3HZR2_PAULE|nr:GMC family oxidoreductase N-terminal domain-containing protein [Paucimonas lemoignei]TCS37851.1 choline dehydrogenase [Paucimonas lemoignei]
MTSVSNKNAETFDYVIVGSGAAGAILASRLSEDGKTTVCLLEAGSSDWHPFIHIPAGFIKTLFNPDFTWQFKSEPTELTGGRRIPLPQGRVLGGSTSINGLVYNRGQRNDYDQWAEMGNAGWSYAEVLPYFKRMERRTGGDDRYRGRNGALPVSDIEWKHPICDAFIAGAQGIGIPRNPDYNGADQAGVGYYQRTINGRWRMSTSRTYLWPARSRTNLAIRTNSQAIQILLEGKRATGVRYMKNRELASATTVLARREVIICAGAINTPKLLQLSGIGPESLLREIGVPVQHHAPGVGANLSDHFSVRLVARVKNISTMNEMARGLGLGGQIARWLLGRPNILALSPSLVHFFWKSREELTLPDLQGVFSPASYKEGYVGMLDSFPGMTAGVWQHRPYSRGTVQARSADVFADPVIQANYLEDERDREVLVNGIRLARRLLQTPELARYAECETLPGPSKVGDDELLDFARRYGVSSYHLNGTARMGRADDAMAVVDNQLRVHGLTGLRVADSSVMPSIPSANICAATMMIAEKASDLILGRAPLAAEELPKAA